MGANTLNALSASVASGSSMPLGSPAALTTAAGFLKSLFAPTTKSQSTFIFTTTPVPGRGSAPPASSVAAAFAKGEPPKAVTAVVLAINWARFPSSSTPTTPAAPLCASRYILTWSVPVIMPMFRPLRRWLAQPATSHSASSTRM